MEGLEFAIKKGWYDFKTFNVSENEQLEKVQNGDINWIVPARFAAFSSPTDTLRESYGIKPELYISQFKKIGVHHVVRLNNSLYD